MDKPPIVATVSLAVDPTTALSQFVDVNSVRQWWGVANALIEPREGGVWTLGWRDNGQGYAYVMSGVIARYIPGEELVVESVVYMHPTHPILGPMRLTVRADPDGPATRLTVRQEGYKSGEAWDWYFNAVREGWPMALEMLQRHLRAT